MIASRSCDTGVTHHNPFSLAAVMDKYVSLEEYRELLSKRNSVKSPFVLSEYNGMTLPPGVADVIDDLKTFEVREDDSWVVTYPKAGTTWVQEIVSAVMHDGNLEAVNKRHTVFRVPFIEHSIPERVRLLKNLPQTHKLAEEIPSPRVLKSHLPGQLLPPQLWEKKPKIVYVIRDPKDVAVSFFYFLKLYHPQRADQTFREFFEEMITGKVPYGEWWDHYLFFWKKRHEPNVLLLRFEDLKRDLRGNVEKISQFLGKTLSSETLDAITEHCTFANMRSNPITNMDSLLAPSKASGASFMRKGRVGDWKSHFTVAQNEAMDALIKEKLHGTGLTFDN